MNWAKNRLSVLKIQESIGKTESRMNSIIMWSPTLNRNENVDLGQISNKLRESFKLKIQEIRSAHSRQADEENEEIKENSPKIDVKIKDKIASNNKQSYLEESMSSSESSKEEQKDVVKETVKYLLFYINENNYLFRKSPLT